MKIILRADVENLGRLGDVVTVKAGYGRNYLLPQGLAMLVTPGNLKAFELERKKLQARMDALRSAADELAGKIEGLVLTIPMRVGDNDKLYGSVTTGIIGDALAEQGIEVDRRPGALPGGASAVREMLRRHLSARQGFGRTAAKKGVSPGGSHP